jgi:hypothetical protein
MFWGQEDVEEKIEHPFRCDVAYITDRDTVPSVCGREIYLWRWLIEWKSAFLTEHLAAVHLAFRKGIICSV